MGIEFYKMVDGFPILVRGGALRVMQWVAAESSFADEASGVAYIDEERLAEFEAAGAAYREAMEEAAAAYLAGAVCNEAAFEKSLQVSLPVEGHQRRGRRQARC